MLAQERSVERPQSKHGTRNSYIITFRRARKLNKSLPAVIRYVRIPTDEPTGTGTSATAEPSSAFTEVSIPHSQLSASVAAAGSQGRHHLLRLIIQLLCIGCYFGGRKCGPTLLIAFVLYIYVSGYLVSSFTCVLRWICLLHLYIYCVTFI